MKNLYLLLIYVMLLGCTRSNNTALEYDFTHPDEVFELPKKLSEISGIAFSNDSTLACIEDEHGILYQYNLHEKKITREIKFSEKGDYEDISIHSDSVFVLRSDGRLLSFTLQNPDSVIAKPLTDEKVEWEGVFVTPNNIWIADKAEKSIRAIESGRIIKSISFPKASHFAPSAIAIHPVSKEIYVLGTIGKSLIILSNDGEVKSTIKLTDKRFTQPEGIAFNQQGNLYISNEGRGGRGNILMFRHQKNQRP